MIRRICDLNSGNWINPLTNVTSLNLAHFQHGAELVFEGQTPRVWLPYLLHEGSHHICLQSLVGQAAAVVHLQARRLLFTATESAHRLAYELYVRAEVVYAMLTPILEGLAMFQEFDAVVSPDFSFPPEAWIPELFLRNSEQADWRGTSEMVREHRCSSNGVQRRIDALSRPYTIIDDDLYLIGYCTVRQMYRIAWGGSRTFMASGAFSSLVRGWFFEDFTLVDLLLNTADDPSAVLAKIIKHLGAQLFNFFSLDFEPLAAYLTSLSKDTGPLSDDNRYFPFSPPPDLRQQTLATLNDATKKLEDDSVLPNELKEIALLDIQSLTGRHWLTVGRAEGIVAVEGRQAWLTNEDGRLMIGDPARPDISNLERLSGHAILEVFMSPYMRLYGWTVDLDDGYRIGNIIGARHQKQRELLLIMRPKPNAFSELEAIFDDAFEQYEKQDHLITVRHTVATCLWEAHRRMLWCSDDRLDEVSEQLRSAGIAGLVRSETLLRSLAIFGMLASVLASRDQIKEAFEHLSISMDDSLRELDRVGNETGLRLVADRGDWIETYI